MSDSNHHANALVNDTTRKANAGNPRMRKLMLLINVLVLAASLTVAVGYFSDRSRAQQGDDRSRGQNQKEYDQQISDNAQRMMDQGKQIFRYDTFGSEDFWGGKLRLHESIAGQKLGGVGAGVSPKTALALGLKVDAEALPADLVAQIKAGKVDLDDPATTVALLKLRAVVGVTGFFNTTGQLRSLGIQCALCHSIGPSESARCPDLKGIGAKLSREFIFESLTQPQAYIYLDYRHEGPPKEYPARMPYINKNPIGLTKNEILSVIAFLQQMSGEPISVSPSELEVPGQSPPAPVKAENSAPVAVAQAR